jgi:hypothetical protein
MGKKRVPSKSEIILGKNIENMRLAKNITRRQLGKVINQLEQKVKSYEKGGFVPLTVIEDIGDAFNERVPKRIIRRISTFRKNEIAHNIIHDELCDLYNEAFEMDEDEIEEDDDE